MVLVDTSVTTQESAHRRAYNARDVPGSKEHRMNKPERITEQAAEEWAHRPTAPHEMVKAFIARNLKTGSRAA
jgi:hypothetical protein